MNKAFIKENDPTSYYCPRCQSLGIPVNHQTMRAHLREDAERRVADSAYFCEFPTCEVVYFDAFERVALVSDLVHSVYPKDDSAAMCACFGFGRDDIEADVSQGVATRTRALLDRAKSAEARCHIRSASGRSCVADVQRTFMKLRAERGPA